MSLINSVSKEAFAKNVSTEHHEGKKPIKQALAIAYATQRRASMKKKSKKKGY